MASFQGAHTTGEDAALLAQLLNYTRTSVSGLRYDVELRYVVRGQVLHPRIQTMMAYIIAHRHDIKFPVVVDRRQYNHLKRELRVSGRQIYLREYDVMNVLAALRNFIKHVPHPIMDPDLLHGWATVAQGVCLLEVDSPRPFQERLSAVISTTQRQLQQVEPATFIFLRHLILMMRLSCWRYSAHLINDIMLRHMVHFFLPVLWRSPERHWAMCDQIIDVPLMVIRFMVQYSDRIYPGSIPGTGLRPAVARRRHWKEIGTSSGYTSGLGPSKSFDGPNRPFSDLSREDEENICWEDDEKSLVGSTSESSGDVSLSSSKESATVYMFKDEDSQPKGEIHELNWISNDRSPWEKTEGLDSAREAEATTEITEEETEKIICMTEPVNLMASPDSRYDFKDKQKMQEDEQEIAEAIQSFQTSWARDLSSECQEDDRARRCEDLPKAPTLQDDLE